MLLAVNVFTLAATTSPLPPAAAQDNVPDPLFERNPDELAGHPLIPVVGGSPVALVKTKAVGVPRAGVTNVGEVEKTMLFGLRQGVLLWVQP